MQQHYTNDTDAPQYVGGKLIPPGETRLVDVPVIAASVAVAEAPQDPLLMLASGKVTDITSALPNLDANQVDVLLTAENGRAGGPRKTLIQALELRKLEIIDVAKRLADEAAAAAAAVGGSDPATSDHDAAGDAGDGGTVADDAGSAGNSADPQD